MVTNKNKNIKDFYLYYNVPEIIVFAIFLCVIHYILVHFIFYFLNLKQIELWNTLSGLFFVIIWTIIVFYHLKSRYYYHCTGRIYSKDRHDFDKDFFYLCNFFSNNDPYKMDVHDLPDEDWHDADGIILCKKGSKLIKRASDADGNLATFGLPGSGKSTCQASTSALRFNNGKGGVFAISIKGDLLNFISGKRDRLKIFTPDRIDGSCHYNPLEGIRNMSITERRIFIENLSIIICPDEQGEHSSYFVNGARDYFCGVALYILDQRIDITFPEIVDFILKSNVFSVTSTIKKSNTVACEYTNSYEGSNEKNVSGIYNHLCKCVRPFNNGALKSLFDGKGDCISPKDLEYGDVIIDVPQDKYQIYAPAMSIIISNFLLAFMRKKDISSNGSVNPYLFLLDEAPQLKIPFSLLSQAMSTLRSKKVSIFLLMQSIAQLEGQYGQIQAHEIMDLCAYISVFNAQDPHSRAYFQELIGKRKMLKKGSSYTINNKSLSHGSNISIVDEYIFEEADFGDFSIYDPKEKKRKKRVLVYAKGKYILGETTPCFE